MPRSILRRRGALALVVAATLAVAVGLTLFAGSTFTDANAARSTVRVAASDDAARIDLLPGGSEARYRAQEVLSGRGFNEAVGRTRDVSGSILLDVSGGVLTDRSRVSVDVRNLKSDNSMRDNYTRRVTLQTDRFPMANFLVSAAPGLPTPLPTSGEAAFELVGDLTVHGITRPATWQIVAAFSANEVSGTAITDIRFTDFGMEPPRAGPVLTIEDALRLEIKFRAAVYPAVALAE